MRTLSMFKQINQEIRDYAKAVIVIFLKSCMRLFGKPFIVHVVHILLHIPDDCFKFGHPEDINCYRFEDLNFHLINQVRGHRNVIQQVVNRYEENCFHELYGPLEKPKTGVQIIKQLKNGRICQIQVNEHIYRCDRTGDQYCEVDDRIFKIHSFELRDDSSVFVKAHEFRSKTDLFSYPCKSRNVGILECHDFCPSLHTFPAKNITGKYCAVPTCKKKNLQ